MRKTLMAVTLFSGMASLSWAQSNVHLYGLLDMGYVTARSNTDKTSAINSGVNNGSRLGFRGSEALGSGISAIFSLEYQLFADRNYGIGGSGYSTRQAYVGVESGYGSVLAGRLPVPGEFIEVGFDSTDSSNSFSALAPLADAAGSTMRIRLNNAAAYVSPTVYGFSAAGAYSFAGAGDVTGASDGRPYGGSQERILGIRVSYDMGPLALAFGSHRADNLGNLVQLDQRENMWGASYDFGMAKLFSTYQTVKTRLGSATIRDGNVWSFGATLPLGNDLLRVQYARLNRDGGLGTGLLSGMPLTRAGDDANGFGIRYDHVLSKRTFAYAGYARISNEGLSGVSTYVGGVTIRPGTSSNGYGFGIEHRF